MVLLLCGGLLRWWWFRRGSPVLRQVHEGKSPQELRRLDGVCPQVLGFQGRQVGGVVEDVPRGMFFASAARAHRRVRPAHLMLVVAESEAISRPELGQSSSGFAR